MARYKRGDIVVLPFPFSDANGAKVRPCLVVAELPYFGGTDYLVCMISTQNTSDPQSIELMPFDIVLGKLDAQSYLRPLYLFAASGDVLERRIGVMHQDMFQRVLQAIVKVVNP